MQQSNKENIVIKEKASCGDEVSVVIKNIRDLSDASAYDELEICEKIRDAIKGALCPDCAGRLRG